MKKTIIILMLLSLVLYLCAQQNQQIKHNKQIKQSNNITKTKKKMNYELEYHNLNDVHKKLQAQKKELHMKWQQLDKKHKALIKSIQNNKNEVDAVTKANLMLETERHEYKIKWETLQKKHNRFRKNFQKMKTENESLEAENIKLKAELEELKPPKKKVLKKVINK